MSLFLPDRRFAGPQRREPLELDQVSARIQRLLEQTFAGVLPATVDGLWSPLVDIEEEDDAYVLEAELPGIKKDDVKIEYAGNELTISGELKERQRKGVLRHRARRTGGFLYRVVLPERVDADRIEAKLQDGVLVVRAPKAQKAQRRKVEIKAG